MEDMNENMNAAICLLAFESPRLVMDDLNCLTARLMETLDQWMEGHHGSHLQSVRESARRTDDAREDTDRLTRQELALAVLRSSNHAKLVSIMSQLAAPR